MIKIIVNNGQIRAARKWCQENLGAIPLKSIEKNVEKKILIHQSPNYYFGGKVYDEKEARWLHRFSKPNIFHFSNEDDAMAFKLRWL